MLKLRPCPYCYPKQEPFFNGSAFLCEKCGLTAPHTRQPPLDHPNWGGIVGASNLWNQLYFDIKYGEDSFGPDDEEDYHNEVEE